MKKYLILGLLVWGFGPGDLAAAIKPCAELHQEIAAKLDAVGVKSYQLLIQDKGKALTKGKVVGTCENSSKQIVYIRNNPAPPPAQSVRTAATASKSKPALQAKDTTGQQKKAKPQPSSAIKPCAELHREIAAKLDAVGVKSYQLLIIDKDEAQTGPGKIVGRCENGSKRIRYIRGE